MRAWSVDSEYGFRGGAEIETAFVPAVLCVVNVETGERHAFWGRDPRLARFVREHATDLWVSHNLIAEAKYMLRLGVAPPLRWFDTQLARRYTSNAEVVPKFNLLDTLTAFGIPHANGGDKKKLQKWIGNVQFNPDSPDDRRVIRSYCFADCDATALLYRRLIGRVLDVWMRYAVEFCLAVARMELRGIGFDTANYARLLERREEVVEEETEWVNRICPVFIRGQLSRQRFLSWCVANGICWPTNKDGKLSLDKKAFERMKDRHPFIRAVREANKTAKQFNNRDLAVDFGTRRHYFGDIAFGASSGRTTFKGFLFSAPKWMRWLAVPPSKEHLLVSVDFTAEEIMIAAHLSRDANMLHGYTSGDPHMAFAILAGAAPPGATKKTHGTVRQRYKAVNLGVNYGQSAFGLAEATGLHFQEAERLLRQHQRTYAAYWAWGNGYTLKAFREGVCWTAGGFPKKVGRTDNPRSVANFAVQGTGGDLMRLATIYLDRHGLRLLAVNHDSFLLECHRDQLAELRQAVDSALRQAVTQVLPGALMRWTVDVYTDRYQDEDGEPSWRRLEGTLAGLTSKRRIG
jgi:DNA polymerase I-like protein with 3'-5' exonuclease and polymerase domains